MDSFRLFNETALRFDQDLHRQAAESKANATEAGVPFLTLIEQALGVETEPDAEFFTDSWTMGIAAATENFLRRRQKPKNRDLEMPAWATFSSFTPWFVPDFDVTSEAPSPLHQQPVIADLEWFVNEEGNRQQAIDEPLACSLTGPMTLESARRLLGVAATSTREHIRLAYRKMASRYHPDRLAQSTPHEQKLASDRMASINEAYQLLCNNLAGRHCDSRIM